MAEVLAPMVSQTGTITMLHSPSDAFSSPTSPQSHQTPRSAAMPRYNGQGGGLAYRGASTAPIAPYAFQSTPQLRQEHRTHSAPGNPYAASTPTTTTTTTTSTTTPMTPTKQWHPQNPSSSSDSTASTASSSRSVNTSKDDTALQANKLLDSPTSTFSFSSPGPDLSLAFETPSKPSPNRYRRGVQRTDSSSTTTPTTVQQQPATRSAPPSGSGMAAVSHLYVGPSPVAGHPGHHRTSSADDTNVAQRTASELAKRYRRRSVGGFEADLVANQAVTFTSATATPINATLKRPSSKDSQKQPTSAAASLHERSGSKESITSSINSNRPSSRPSSRQSSRPSSARQDSSTPSISANQSRTVNVPPRGSSDATKRMANPSPLSNPVSAEPESPGKVTSPAAQQLSALTERDANKGMKSRLRRAFSFGSAAELRRASAENLSKKDRTHEDIEAEHEAIARKQEAAGIGAGIYSGQGGFSGSTDNLSISSTASSASIMLRKMGKGMKKGTRSLKGLFRPKSVVGVPAADAPLTQPSVAQVSMVTVEAEREKVNVNANPHDQNGGGTGFPRLERNSLDTTVVASDPPGFSSGKASVESWSRKSIVGGDRERAEVLAAVKKGILKRRGTNSDSGSPVIRPLDHTDSPHSSAPSTPADDPAVQLSNSDYFHSLPRLPTNMSTKSLPTTPHGTARSISFSPRLQFHDAWSASDYDRRGEIATCNRLTPMLAQQIKEELNSFKMEMEVHELSKPHTHFF